MENLEQRIQVALGSLVFQSIVKDQKIADLEKALEAEKAKRVEAETQNGTIPKADSE